MEDLICTKLAPPAWMGDQIRRDLLLSRLDGALNRRLTLIHAPAGYGKTSLLAQWRQRHTHVGLLTAWLTLEHDDADLNRLARYLSLAVSGAAGDRASDDASYAQPDLPPRAALSAIINRLASEARPVVLILDDLHRAESPALSEFLGTLIRLASPNCHFIVASRDYPRLGQSVLAAEEQLLEFTADDLKFSASETEALFARNQALSVGAKTVGQICDRTEGWPIALQLIFLSLKRGGDPNHLIEHFSGSSSELARYLSEQVLVSLPPQTQEIVIRTALIDRLSGDIVNMLCDRQDGWLILESLEHQGVFLTSERDGGQTYYRYHQLFAEYLRERLAHRDATQFGALHRIAARWFSDHRAVSEAIHHAVLADDNDLLAMIVEEAGAWRLIPQGLKNEAARALAKLPEASVTARPRLLLMRIYLAIKCGELGAARTDQDRIEQDSRTESLSADLRTEIRMVSDVLTEYENQPVTLHDLLDRETLLRTLPTNDHLMLGHFCESLGSKYYEGGWLERALEPTLAAREHHQALGSLYSELFTRFLESRIRRAQGRLRDATILLGTAHALIGDNFGERSDLAANCAAFEAELLYEQDQLDDASARLQWSLPHMEQSDGWVDVYAAAYFTEARIAAAHGSLDDASAILARARRLAQRRRLRQLEWRAQLCELQLMIEHGDDDAAADLATQIELDRLADDMTSNAAVYRPVVVAAALCRVELQLLRADGASAALQQLQSLRQWASQHGAGRLLIDINLLTASGLLQCGQEQQAQARFDEAVGIAMFQGIVRPFIDARRFVEPLLKTALRGNNEVDRFRDQFLKTLSRAFASRLPSQSANGPLSEAEIDVLTHLARGYSNKEIARLIHMSPDTVKYRLKSLFRKLGVTRRHDAVRVCHERGLVIDSVPAADAEVE